MRDATNYSLHLGKQPREFLYHVAVSRKEVELILRVVENPHPYYKNVGSTMHSVRALLPRVREWLAQFPEDEPGPALVSASYEDLCLVKALIQNLNDQVVWNQEEEKLTGQMFYDIREILNYSLTNHNS